MRAKGGAAVYWLWLFCLYSFLGYLLEKAFAAATGSRHQVRKCFLLLPLCPVYGLAMLAVLHLPADLRRGFSAWPSMAALRPLPWNTPSTFSMTSSWASCSGITAAPTWT